jgi:alcohol dehydrogenase (cytochrome c)
MGGKQLMAVAPKDGYLYGFDRADNSLLYRVPVTRVEDVVAPFSPGTDVHFCPGSVGGAEWNSPAYDPKNLVLIGEVDWCTQSPRRISINCGTWNAGNHGREWRPGTHSG